MHTIDPKMLMAWADVLAFGAQKYHQRNFLKAPGMAWSRVYDSLNRHLWAFWAGEWLDEESGLPHLAHVMCNLQFLWTYHENSSYHVSDDRPSSIEFKGAQYNEWEERFKEASEPPERVVPDIFGGLARSGGRARWREQLFGSWQPLCVNGEWVVVRNRMAKPAQVFVDEMDREVKHKMDEDEALNRARALNAMGWDGYDPNHEHWLIEELK